VQAVKKDASHSKMELPEKEVLVSDEGKGEALPLVVRPATEGNVSAEFLRSWISRNTEWLDGKLLKHGAVLFRGFRVETGRQFQTVVQQYCPSLSDAYRGTSPRRLVDGTRYVFSASELLPSYPIPQHIEMSFLPAPPRFLFFCCLEAPTSVGGETSLCDFRKVYQQLDPAVRRDFEQKRVLYSRYYTPVKSGLFSDPTMMKGWQDVFGTPDKAAVVAELRETGQDFCWEGDNLRICSQQAAVETHPLSGEKIWFNHTLVFHFTMLSSELYRVYKRMGGLKYRLLSWFYWFLKFWFFSVRGSSRVGFHTSFGDGSDIPEGHLEHVRDVVWKNMVFNHWKQGDVVMIDNFRISHGRQPFSGRRKIVVSWSQPYTKPSLHSIPAGTR
jgi:alpha-ketoglutarate-dependent taurine dioxygenase